MSFNSLLDRLCTIEAQVSTQDISGQQIKAWSTLASNIKCRLDPVGGGLQTKVDVIYESATHELFMRKQSSITLTTKEHRIIIDGDSYTILLVSDLHNSLTTNHLEILLEKNI